MRFALCASFFLGDLPHHQLPSEVPCRVAVLQPELLQIHGLGQLPKPGAPETRRPGDPGAGAGFKVLGASPFEMIWWAG